MNKKDRDAQFRSAAESSPILAGVGSKELDELAGMALCHEYPKNNILFYQGDPTGAIFLVITGKVKLTLMNEEGREVVVALARPGDLFGLVAALDGGTQPANAITIQRCHLAKFDGEAFLRWFVRQKTPQPALLSHLARLVREAYQKVGEHALMGVKERLLYALLDIAELEGQLEPDGEMIVFTRPTHQELAHRIGSSREVVSRLLKELLDSELLQAEGRIIRVSESALVLRED